jgi:hypothetical protein
MDSEPYDVATGPEARTDEEPCRSPDHRFRTETNRKLGTRGFFYAGHALALPRELHTPLDGLAR